MSTVRRLPAHNCRSALATRRRIGHYERVVHAGDSTSKPESPPFNQTQPLPPWRWWARHRRRVEDGRQWRQGYEQHQLALQPSLDLADFRSWKDFYEADERRRCDDVEVGEVRDGELRWKLCWHSGTQEVVAYGVAWIEERWHNGSLVGDTAAHEGRWSGTTIGPDRVPDVIHVLGCAETAEDAKWRLRGARDLTEARALVC
jgi:hypothetical protein